MNYDTKAKLWTRRPFLTGKQSETCATESVPVAHERVRVGVCCVCWLLAEDSSLMYVICTMVWYMTDSSSIFASTLERKLFPVELFIQVICRRESYRKIKEVSWEG